MMALEDRVEGLEEESRQTRELVTVCAGAAESAQVAHQQNRVLLNALAEVQGNHTDRLNTIDGRLDRIDGRLDRVDGRLDRVEQKLAEHDQRFDRVEGRLDRVEQKLAEHDQRFDRVEGRLDRVEQKLAEHDQRFDDIDQQLGDIRGTIGKVAVGMYTLEKLIRRLVPEDGGAN